MLRGVLSAWTPGGPLGFGRSTGRTQRLRGGTVRQLGADHIHRVRNDTLEPAMSLHVYAPRLATMTRYRNTGGRWIPLATERAGADW